MQPLVSELGELLLNLSIHLRRLLGLRKLPPGRLLALVVGSTLDLSPLLESVETVKVIFNDAALVIVTYLATTSWYFHPNS